MSIEALRNHLMVARDRQGVGVWYRILQNNFGRWSVWDRRAPDIFCERGAKGCRFLPLSDPRPPGFYPLIPMNYGRMDLNEHTRLANENVLVAIMIETAQAVEEIEEILAIEGLDSVVLGLMDLSGSYGVLGQTKHPKVLEAVDKVIAASKVAGKYVGTGRGANADVVCELIRRGIQWVQTGSDVTNMVEFYDNYLAIVRSRLSGY